MLILNEVLLGLNNSRRKLLTKNRVLVRYQTLRKIVEFTDIIEEELCDSIRVELGLESPEMHNFRKYVNYRHDDSIPLRMWKTGDEIH